MNDELVSHNNSNGGWAVLNKWVSMLKEEGCMFDPLKARGGGGGWGASNCKLHCVVCRLKCVEFHQHIAISALASSEEMSYVKYYLFRLFCVGFYWYAKHAGGAGGFPWNVKGHVENVLPADLVFHSVSAPLRYTCCNFNFCLAGSCTSVSVWAGAPSALDDSLRPGLLLLTVGRVRVLIAQLPAHLQPRATP